MQENLYKAVQDVLLEGDPGRKSEAAAALLEQWQGGFLWQDRDSPILPIDIPGRPEFPRLIDPRKLSRRTTATQSGRLALIHAIAHIEFNAINIALDAAYRFRQMPVQFVNDWLLVASEEAKHFNLLNQYLHDQGSFYGAYEAHNGLWDMVCKTRDDVLHRMALVPRVMEARGLDVTPGMIRRFGNIGDQRVVEILEVIYRDEIGHVRIGNYWFQYLCEERRLDSAESFRKLVETYLEGNLRGPFNWQARIEAGFEAAELKTMEQGIRRSPKIVDGTRND
jgi:uncharacterized ferritin-like protein (DUF455 family)